MKNAFTSSPSAPVTKARRARRAPSSPSPHLPSMTEPAPEPPAFLSTSFPVPSASGSNFDYHGSDLGDASRGHVTDYFNALGLTYGPITMPQTFIEDYYSADILSTSEAELLYRPSRAMAQDSSARETYSLDNLYGRRDAPYRLDQASLQGDIGTGQAPPEHPAQGGSLAASIPSTGHSDLSGALLAQGRQAPEDARLLDPEGSARRNFIFLSPLPDFALAVRSPPGPSRSPRRAVQRRDAARSERSSPYRSPSRKVTGRPLRAGHTFAAAGPSGRIDTDSALPRGGPASEAVPAPAEQATDLPARPPTYQCSWNGDCKIPLDDISSGGITRHLREFHLVGDRWANKARGRCLWSDCTHDDDMDYASFGKHVSAVHLGALKQPCEFCGGTFARQDSLTRHKRRCPERPA